MRILIRYFWKINIYVAINRVAFSDFFEAKVVLQSSSLLMEIKPNNELLIVNVY